MSKVVRTVKNVTKGYTSAQVKVRNATSNDAWGPTGQEMAEIASMTYTDTATFYEIMDILDKRLNDKGKNWRHVLKSLKVLDYCLHEGSDLVVTWARENIYIIRTLREFQHLDDDNKDVGQNIRVSAKELTSLIMDDERLRVERRDRKSWKSRVSGLNDYDEPHTKPRRRERNNRGDGDRDDDLEMRLAIEASKNEAEEEAKRRAKKGGPTEDTDDDLAKAIKLSKEEEEARKKELEDANANSLFDTSNSISAQPAAMQPTGWNQGYQQQPSVDWFGNVIDQQPQNTGYPVQNTGMPYQHTMQPQMTGYNPNFMNMQMQPQQTAFNTNNPYAQQPNNFGFGQNQTQQQPQTQPQEQAAQPGSNNPWANTSNTNGTDSMKPMATGSNNPFASSLSRPQTQPPRQPTLNSIAEQNASSYNPIMNFTSPTSPVQPISQPSYPSQPSQPSTQTSAFVPQQTATPLDPHRARLNNLLANADGQDTFGNWGEQRVLAQHTSPGTFVNSAGANLNRLTETATGNPFNRIPPAATGPGGAYGNNNPFGQTPQRGQGGANLIDL